MCWGLEYCSFYSQGYIANMLMRKEDKCTISVEHFANTKRYLYDDTEIYIDGHATSTFRSLYEPLQEQRQTIIQKYKQADKDFYSQTLLAAEVKEEDFFCHGTPSSMTYGNPMSMTLTARRIILLQRKLLWKSGKPFNSPGIISERCGRSFSICSALTFTNCPLMNR